MSTDPSPTSPRAFATTTGVVFQVAGVLYFLTAAAYWFISGRVQTTATVPIQEFADYFDRSNILLATTTAIVLAAVAGGLALATFGVGLQSEKRYSGIAAMITAALLAVVALSAAALYVIFGPSWFRFAFAVLFAAANTILFLLAGHSAAILRRHPPPPDQNTVTDAWLEQYNKNRKRM